MGAGTGEAPVLPLRGAASLKATSNTKHVHSHILEEVRRNTARLPLNRFLRD